MWDVLPKEMMKRLSFLANAAEAHIRSPVTPENPAAAFNPTSTFSGFLAP